MNHHYNPKLKLRARKLRNSMTKSEVILWKHVLRNSQSGEAFKRQRPMDWFILDFYCHRLKLAIELDGYTHHFKETQINDKRKDERLSKLGVEVWRIPTDRIYNDLDTVKQELYQRMEERKVELGLEDKL